MGAEAANEGMCEVLAPSQGRALLLSKIWWEFLGLGLSLLRVLREEGGLVRCPAGCGCPGCQNLSVP